MGLDLVMFALSVEDAFQVVIPNRDAEELLTPGRLIDYLTSRLPPGHAPPCLCQRAFYTLRTIICRRLNLSPRALGPSNDLLDLIPEPERARTWRTIAEELGARRYWPKLARPGWGWFEGMTSPRLHRFGDIVRFVAVRNPCLLLRPGEGWSRHQVAEVVHGLVREQLGLRRHEYAEDWRWSEDMGLS